MARSKILLTASPHRLKAKQVKALRRSLKRSGQADLRVGSCRRVSKHNTQVCRDSKGYFVSTSWHKRARIKGAKRSQRLSMHYQD